MLWQSIWSCMETINAAGGSMHGFRRIRSGNRQDFFQAVFEAEDGDKRVSPASIRLVSFNNVLSPQARFVPAEGFVFVHAACRTGQTTFLKADSLRRLRWKNCHKAKRLPLRPPRVLLLAHSRAIICMLEHKFLPVKGLVTMAAGTFSLTEVFYSNYGYITGRVRGLRMLTKLTSKLVQLIT